MNRKIISVAGTCALALLLTTTSAFAYPTAKGSPFISSLRAITSEVGGPALNGTQDFKVWLASYSGSSSSSSSSSDDDGGGYADDSDDNDGGNVNESDSFSTEPLSTEPLSTEPLSTEPLTTEPLTTEPLTTEPLTTELLTTEPLTSELLTPEPLITPLTAQDDSTISPFVLGDGAVGGDVLAALLERYGLTANYALLGDDGQAAIITLANVQADPGAVIRVFLDDVEVVPDFIVYDGTSYVFIFADQTILKDGTDIRIEISSMNVYTGTYISIS